MTPDQMLSRATQVFVGVIEEHDYDPKWQYWLYAGIPQRWRSESSYWGVKRRRVRVEMLIRGKVPPTVDVYEIAWMGATTGDWNFTQNGGRYLFMVRMEDGHYHVTRDWRRSIFPLTKAARLQLPLNESHSLWERWALMSYWVENGSHHWEPSEPEIALDEWRRIKLLRGLVRHPSPKVRIPACWYLLGNPGFEECWDQLTDWDRSHMRDGGRTCCVAADIAEKKAMFVAHVGNRWRFSSRAERRVLTTVNHRAWRAEFCRLYEREYPGDTDNGCPVDRPPPASIVRAAGDVPLLGAWPR